MKPFECSVCGKKAAVTEADARWHYESEAGSVSFLHIAHNSFPCNDKGEGGFFNRSLPLEYVWKHMPEFISYIKRLDIKEKEVRDFVRLIEKDRSYIRRHTIDKKEVKKLIIRLEGSGRCAV